MGKYFVQLSFRILNGVSTWNSEKHLQYCLQYIWFPLQLQCLKSNANNSSNTNSNSCGSVLWRKWNPWLNCHIIMFFGMAWSHFPRAHYLLSLAIIILGCITTGKSTSFHLQQDWGILILMLVQLTQLCKRQKLSKKSL